MLRCYKASDLEKAILYMPHIAYFKLFILIQQLLILHVHFLLFFILEHVKIRGEYFGVYELSCRQNSWMIYPTLC